MISETTILLIAQISASLAVLTGIGSLYFMYKAQSGLISGEFKDTITASVIFLLAVIISGAAMVAYHFSYNTSEITEEIWIYGTFLSLALSVYESSKLISFGKQFASLKKIQKKKK